MAGELPPWRAAASPLAVLLGCLPAACASASGPAFRFARLGPTVSIGLATCYDSSRDSGRHAVHFPPCKLLTVKEKNSIPIALGPAQFNQFYR